MKSSPAATRFLSGGEVVADEAALPKWAHGEQVIAVAVDTPVVGWRGKRVNTLRLWTAHAIDPIRLDAFNAGDHIGALADKARAESLTRVLYPADSSPAGQELRPAPGIFLLVGVPSGHFTPPSAVFRRYPHPARQGTRSSSTIPIRRCRSPR
ncbi:MAG: glycogen/starch/alpha-glucan phosphorylase [Asticcacaulis sp.]